MKKYLVIECRECGNFAVTPIEEKAFVPASYKCSGCGCDGIVRIAEEGSIFRDVGRRFLEEAARTFAGKYAKVLRPKGSVHVQEEGQEESQKESQS